MKKIIPLFLEQLDPTKTYLIESDIEKWHPPSDQVVQKSLEEFSQGNFATFREMFAAMQSAVKRREKIDKTLYQKELPANVKPEEFKELQWTKNLDELKERILRIRSLQVASYNQLDQEATDLSLKRIDKVQKRFEAYFNEPDPKLLEQFFLSRILKAIASSLDNHTVYFTPDEAKQFLISVQQRLFGIGVQLRDDLNGLTITRIVEGGPAWQTKTLKVKDRIIAVNGEPIVGMDVTDAVEMIRGKEGTPVILTVIREKKEGETETEEKLDITIVRGEVVIKEARYDSSFEPFGNGVIAYLRLNTFYQDEEHSSADDLAQALERLKKENKVEGVILDLRYNAGGLLTQAAQVAGLFMTKGVVVSIKDNTGFVQHLRDIDGKTAWKGPLIVLINRASASAAEIVAKALQDYGLALIVGDDHSYGKGSFQTFTLSTQNEGQVNPEGEYKVTRGRYYTVSGQTPQLVGVQSDIVVDGPLSMSDIGEKYTKNPLPSDQISPSYDDKLEDVPLFQREKLRLLYRFNLQTKLSTYQPYLERLQQNSAYRLEHNKDYQVFLSELKKRKDRVEGEEAEHFGQEDFQLTEAISIMKDLIFMSSEQPAQ
jgi:carboxyl-terminal processing protease